MLALYFFPLVTVLYFLYARYTSYLAKIPGPWYTLLTSLVLKYHEFSGSRRTWIHSLHEAYGPVVRVAPTEVSFASHDAMKEIYMSGGAGYDRTEFYDMFMQFNTRTMFSTPPKGPHAQRKKILADRYANTNIMRPEILLPLQSRASAFLRNCLSAPHGHTDVYVHLHCFALDGASHLLFAPHGTDSLSNPHDFAIFQELTYQDSLAQHWLIHYAPRVSRLLNHFGLWLSRPSPLANGYVLESARRAGAADVSVIKKLQSKRADLEEMSAPAECMDHLAAGIDTTGDGLCFLMHQLSLPQSAAVQAALRSELLANTDKPFDQLPYLDAVFREGLRCFPPIPMSFPRYVPAGGRTIDGFFFPEKTVVSCQPWTLHRDPVVFPEPEAFKPERWLDAAGKTDRDRMFFSFSQGARGCIGRHLAAAEMKLLLREVYSQCRTTVAAEMKADMSLADQIISSRPKGEKCLLVFERLGERELSGEKA